MIDYLRLVSVVLESDVNISNADSRAPVQLLAHRRLSGFFSNLELAIWVADSPGWFSLSLEPRLPDSEVLPLVNDDGDDGCLA